ncbi:MAG TPA: FAD:protein FMN transferase [Acholeplasmataceae bacterium]|nr:FAD:protein FMN transferase [Acholeplasmataceae bacterium]
MKKTFNVLLMLMLVFILSGCINNDEKNSYIYTFNLGNAFETVSKVQLVSKTKVEEERRIELYDDMVLILDDLDKKFNVVKRNDNYITELMKINNNSGIEPVKVSDEVIYVIEESLKVATMSKVDGIALFDPTIAPVWEIWDFPNLIFSVSQGAVPKEYLPTSTEINELLPLVNYNNVILDKENKTVFLKEKNMALDLGAVVKGYAADVIEEFLLEEGFEKAVIDIGANILLMGSYIDEKGKDAPWNVSIRTPLKDLNAMVPTNNDVLTIGSLKVINKTVVTSGIYEKYIRSEDGIDYHHILDPRTGYSLDNNVVSVSVITDLSIMGDACSTALFALGLDKGMEFVNGNDDIECIFVVSKKNAENKTEYLVYVSNGLVESFDFNEATERLRFKYMGILED